MPEGEFLNPDDRLAILINDTVKKRLNVKVGDTVTIIGRDLFGQAVAQAVKIKGFFKSNIDNPHLNSLVLVDMDTYYLISGFYKGEALYVNLNLKNDYSLEGSVTELNKWAAGTNPDIEFYDFFKVHPGSAHEYEAVRMIVIFICLVVVFIVTFGIMNVVSVNLFDRKKEIGTYYCLGSEKSFLIRLYSAEIFIVNLASSVCGIALGLLIRYLINAAHITTTEEAMQHVFGGNVFYIGLSVSTIIWLLLGIGGLTLITALATLGGSLKVSPVVAIRELEE
jgi:ABC-type lipoprotein release transport system permease subunit